MAETPASYGYAMWLVNVGRKKEVTLDVHYLRRAKLSRMNIKSKRSDNAEIMVKNP